MRDALNSSGRPSRRRRSTLRPTSERLEERSLLSLAVAQLQGSGAPNLAPGIAALYESTSVAVDGQGNTILGGSFQGTVDLDPTRSYPDGRDVLTAASGRDGFVAKFDPTGALVWSRRVGGPAPSASVLYDDRVAGVAVDGNGNVYATGFFQGQTPFGNAADRADVFAWKLDPAGNTAYALAAPGTVSTRSNQALDVAVTPAGEAVLGGFLQNPTVFGGTTLTPTSARQGFIAKVNAAGTGFAWARLYDTGAGEINVVSRLAIDATGDVVTTGFVGNPAGGSADAYVRKYNGLDGSERWTRRVGGPGYDEGTGVAVDGAGNVYAVGRYVGPVDFNPAANTPNDTDATIPIGRTSYFLLKYDAAGNYQFYRDLGGRSADTGGSPGGVGRPSVAVEPGGVGRLVVATAFQGRAIVAANFLSFGGIAFESRAGSVDTMLVRLATADGAVIEARRAGGDGVDVPTAVAAGPGGVVALAGNLTNGGAAGRFTSAGKAFTLPGNVPLAADGIYLARFTEQSAVDRPATDFDGDGEGDLVVYDPMRSDIYMRPSTLGGASNRRIFGPGALFSIPGRINPVAPQAVTGDFDGDGLADVTVYEPDLSQFWTLYSDLNQVQSPPANPDQGPTTLIQAQPFFFGPGSRFTRTALTPVALAGDIDGDGRDDLIVYDPTASTFNGSHFFVLPSNPGRTAQNIRFGPTVRDPNAVPPVPLAADVNGDGKDDLIVYQPETATAAARFFVRLSGATLATALPPTAEYPAEFAFGAGAGTPRFRSTPFAGNFDGDAAEELGVFEPMTGRVRIRNGSFLVNGAARSDFVLAAGTGATASTPLTLGAVDLGGGPGGNADGKDDLVLFDPLNSPSTQGPRVTRFLNAASNAVVSVILGPANPARNVYPATNPMAPNLSRPNPYRTASPPPRQVATLAAPPEAIAPPLAPTVTPRRRVLWKG